MFREVTAGALALILGIVFVVVLGTGLAVWGLFFNRHAAPYMEETRRQVYTNSQSYQQGSQSDFENLCLQYAQAQDAGTKAIIADTIRRRKQDYVGPTLDDNVLSCFARLGL